jgi:zinc/manganese transport system substrate-binding protein
MLRALLAALVLLSSVVSASAQEKLPVVATFSILADFVKNVGGERIELTSLVGADGDAHVYQPSPNDAKKLSAAKVVFTNGLGFEGWMNRLVKSSGAKATVIVASKGVKPLKMVTHAGHDHGDTDPHAWQSVANAKLYVANIRDALIAADPAGKVTYEKNATAYLAQLDELDRDIKEAIARIPVDRRKIITSHEAFGYFKAAYGVDFIAPQGVSTEADVSAKDVARIIRQIKAQKIPAVFMENVSDTRLLKQIAAESGARIGGDLFSDALSAANGPASTYILMMRHNVKQLEVALAA